MCPSSMQRALFMLAILLPAMFSGCFGEEEIVKISEEDAAYLQPWERSGEIYDNSDVFSRVSVNGSYAIDTVRSVYVDVPTITAADGGADAERKHRTPAASAEGGPEGEEQEGQDRSRLGKE